jgi:WD40-like Beta Propeller Repeat
MPTPVAIEGINSEFDDFNSADARGFYRQGFIFSTNRGSSGKQFDLYETTLSWGYPQDSPGAPTPVHAKTPTPFAPELMSESNERGPLVLTDQGSRPRLVFASDRPSGQGGLDLYVAELASSEKVIALRPLGLNSPADDAYLTSPIEDHRMLFASNRDGGENHHIYLATWDAADSIEAAPQDIARVDALSSPADDSAPFVYRNPKGEAEVVFVSARAGGMGEHDLYCARYVDPRTDEERARPAALQGIRLANRWTPPVHLASLSSNRDEYRPIVLDVNGTRFLVFSSTRDGGLGGYDLYVVGYTGCPAT